jgi:hypothetical protein
MRSGGVNSAQLNWDIASDSPMQHQESKMHRHVVIYFVYFTYFINSLTFGAARSDPTSPIRASTTAKILRIAQQLVERLDRNSDQKIDVAEWAALASPSALPDGDADGTADVQEMAAWLTRYGRGQRLWLGAVSTGTRPTAAPEPPTTPLSAADKTTATVTGNPASRPRNQRFFVPPEAIPAGLPEWFAARDADGDGQLTLFEFSPQGVPTEVRDFSTWDVDGDGVVTASEYLARGALRTP